MKTRLKLNWLIVMVMGLTGLPPAARAFYAPAEQRWLNRDPLQGMPSSLLASDALLVIEKMDGPNLYAFVRNEPLSHFDEDGLTTADPNGRKPHKKIHKRTWQKHTTAQGRPSGGARPGNTKPNFTRGPKGARCGPVAAGAAFLMAVEELNAELPPAGPPDANGNCPCGQKRTACFLWWCWDWCEPDCA